jgi:hypothetical protein
MARVYWENVNADVDGMLGGIPAMEGFHSVSRVDLQGSRTFLARLGIGMKKGRKPVVSALDGGAGYVHLDSCVLNRGKKRKGGGGCIMCNVPCTAFLLQY